MNTANPIAPPQSRIWIPLAFVALAVLASGLLVALLRPTASAPQQPDLAKEAEADLADRGFRPLSESLQALLNDPYHNTIPTQTHPLLGRDAPPIRLLDSQEKPWDLAEGLRAGPVVVVFYFYYGYTCDHCVSQLFGIQKDLEKFRELGVTVAAISGDTPGHTRQRFAKYGAFTFPVLSDPDHRVALAYGTFAPPKKEGDSGDLSHGTFVLDPNGRLVWANRGESPFVDNRTLLREVHRGVQRLARP